MHSGFKYYFMPESYDPDGGEEYAFLYSLNETLEAVQRVSDGFWAMPQSSIAVIGYVEEGSLSTCHIPSIVTTNTSDPNYFVLKMPDITFTNLPRERTPSNLNYVYESIPQGPIGEFVPEFNSSKTLSSLIDTMSDFQFEMRLCNENLGKLYRACYEWNVVVAFSFSNYANIYVKVSDDIVGKCDDMDVNEYMSKILHNIGIVVVGLIYLVMVVKDFVGRVKLFVYVKKAHAAAQKVLHDSYLEDSDSDRDDEIDEHFVGEAGETAREVAEATLKTMPWSVFFKFFPFWNFISFLGTFTSVVYSLFTAFARDYHIPTTSLEKVGSGFGCMLLWLSFTQFYQHNNKYYGFILTMQHAVPLLLPFLVGVTPIFLGYAMFGVSYFGSQNALFKTLPAAFETLFSLLNGDVIYQTFTSMWQPNQFIVNVYLYSFISFFIYLVLNVTISVVEHSFFTSQGAPRTFDVFIKRGFAQGGVEGESSEAWHHQVERKNIELGREGREGVKPSFFNSTNLSSEDRQTILDESPSVEEQNDEDKIRNRQFRRKLKRLDRKRNKFEGSRSKFPSRPRTPVRSAPSPNRNNELANDRMGMSELTLHEENVLLDYLKDEIEAWEADSKM